MTSPAQALFTTTQQRLLSLLYGDTERSSYLREILRQTGMGVGTVKRELDRMVAAGILKRSQQGNQHHYQADKSCPIHEELAAIVRKTLGLSELLRQTLNPIADQIQWAFVFGSIASGAATGGSDVDLMVIGDLDFEQLSQTLYPAQEALGREINPKLYRPEEWRALFEADDRFVQSVLKNPRIDLIGEEL